MLIYTLKLLFKTMVYRQLQLIFHIVYSDCYIFGSYIGSIINFALKYRKYVKII